MSAQTVPPFDSPVRSREGQAGLTLLEVLVTMTLMAILASSMATLVGAAMRSKLIVAVRSADVATARHTLEWMSERLRHAGFNLKPSEQSAPRCRDSVVAQDASLQPTANSLYVSGEIINTDTIAGNEVITLGYLLGTDSRTGNQVVMEYRQPCAGGSVSMNPLSNSRVAVTSLGFAYFSDAGVRITDLTAVDQIRLIRLIRISLTVQAAEGRSGVHTLTATRDVMLRNPEPNANDWKDANESP